MARKKRNSVDVRDGYHFIVMGGMEIWDGADLALLRETLSRLVDTEKNTAIGVDMTFVKYIPSGFFGMLYDYRERGVAVRLSTPQPHVMEMLWFREFFEEVQPGVFELRQRGQTSRSTVPANTSASAPWLLGERPTAAEAIEPHRSSVQETQEFDYARS
ncbi:MAG: STAS domain-containing protein [Planctomycetota bacterium]|jgi:anti-anti-sigma regulatory factor